MPGKNENLNDEDEVMRRCRRVRKELYQRFKTPEERHAWLMSLEKQPDNRSGVRNEKARAHCKATQKSAIKRRVKTAPAPHDAIEKREPKIRAE